MSSNEPGELNSLAMQRLIRAVGPSVGPEAARQALSTLGIHELSSPTELLGFAEQLILRGGVFEAVGRGLKISALLRGARA